MRRLIFAFALVAASPIAASAPASAQIYPWCSIYSGTMAGGENCGFVTYRQCMENVSGIGGFCQRNPLWRPPSKQPHRDKRYRDRYDER